MKVCSALLAAFVAFAAVAAPTAPKAEPKAYIVFDLESGTVIDQKDAFRPWYPASVTKLMTAYVTFRAIRSGKRTLQSPVVVTANALSEPPSKMGFPVGTRLTLDNALKMVLVKSANDIAVALGESVSGSETAFLADMNAEAKRLGMTRTHFNNPHGLPDDGHVTTARDMAVLSNALMKEFPEYRHYYKTSSIRHGKRRLRSANALLERYPGATGMKTGYICNSGFNMVASATRSGQTIIAVVFGGASSMDRNVAAAALLDKGFAASKMLPGGQKLATLVRPSDPGELPAQHYCRRAKKPSAKALLLNHATRVKNGNAYASGGRSAQEILDLALKPAAKKSKKKKRKSTVTRGQVLDVLVGPRVQREPVQVVLGAPIVSVVTGKTPMPADKPIKLAVADIMTGTVDLRDSKEPNTTVIVRKITTDRPAAGDAETEIEPIDIPGIGPSETVAAIEPWPKKIGGIAIPQPRPSL